MSSAPSKLESKPNSDGTASIESYHNPTYPKRDHYADRARLEQALGLCKERIATALERLNRSASLPDRASLVRIYHQLLGIRDQLAESVRRMPLETGDLYTEDNERFEQAVAALDRVWQQWQKTGG